MQMTDNLSCSDYMLTIIVGIGACQNDQSDIV